MSETLLRQHEILLNVPLPPIGSAIDKLKEQAIRKEARRLSQIAASRAHYDASNPAPSSSELDSTTAPSASTKRKDPPSPPASGTSTPTGDGPSKQQREQEKPRRKGDPVPFGTVQGKPIEAARGHTSYLTFATLLPVGLRGGKEGVVEDEEEMEGEEDGELDAGESRFGLGLVLELKELWLTDLHSSFSFVS